MTPTSRFSDRVENYIKARPTYPKAFYDFLANDLGLTAGKVIADIGSGTGISARPLLERGCTVIGVEPNEPMRQAAERLLANHAAFRSIDGTAETTNLAGGSVDAILAAQAFHWFDRNRAKVEFRRILKPDGAVILVWNERRTDSTPFLREYEALLIEQGTDYARVRHENVDDAAIAAFFAPVIPQRHQFDNAQHFDEAGFIARVFSSSYTPAKDDPRYAPMLDAVRNLFAKHANGGQVTFEYDTRVHYGRW